MPREHVHLIGIGGTGMTALAGLLWESGCRVTGSDGQLYPPTSTLLEDLGLEVHAGFDARHLTPAPDLVVIGNAVSRGNPEAEEVLDRRLPHTSMARVVAERFLEGRHSIVVAGTHGKTTTTAMLSWVLQQAGRDPGFLVGGLPFNFERPYRLGGGKAFVIEGDEYDTAFFDKGPKFMHYRPDTAIIGTVEFDHADIYRDLDQIRTVFERFVNIIPRRGLLVLHEDCEVTRDLSRRARSRVQGYGLESGFWQATGVREEADGVHFTVLRDGRAFGAFSLAVPGLYNVRNALAVTAAAHEQGLSADEIAQGLKTFRGVKRRLELRGEVGGVTVLEDFAHHPTAISETLKAVRRRWTGGRLWAVLEPRSWSLRRNVFQERLAEVFDAADRVIVSAVYRAADVPNEERLDPEAVVRNLVKRGQEALYIADVEGIVRHLETALRPGDVVTVMSNGAFGGLQDRLLRTLEARGAAGRSE